MIPKVIHYCWFGGNPMPPLAQACLETWEAHLDGYAFKRWDETNAPQNDFVRYHLEKCHWAFVSDYVRLHALYQEGGIYMDTDFEVLRPFDDLLERSGFIAYESGQVFTNGIAGSEKGHPFFKACMEYMAARHREKLPYQTTPQVTMAVYAGGDYTVDILPSDYFYPYNPYDGRKAVKTLMARMITPQTYAIHHWARSWHDSELKNVRPLCRLWKKIYMKGMQLLRCK